MYTLNFTILDLPKPVNRTGRLHWAVKNKITKEWHQRVRIEVETLGAPSTPLKKAFVMCERHSAVCPDYDGLVSSFKHVIDGLVVTGVLEDDSMKHIGMPEFKWFKTKRGEGYIRVCVVEAGII